MYEDEIAAKKAYLAELDDALITSDHKLKSIEREIKTLYKTRQTYLLIRAGQVIREAGILECYDRNKLYGLLIEHKREII